MAAQAGKDVVLRMGDGLASESFTAVAGLRAKAIALNARAVEVTHADSPGQWRELLGGAGLKSAAITGSGVFVDSAADAMVRAAFFDQTRRNWQIVIPDFGRISGPFLVTGLDYAGRHDGEASWTLSLSSAGLLGFAAI